MPLLCYLQLFYIWSNTNKTYQTQTHKAHFLHVDFHHFTPLLAPSRWVSHYSQYPLAQIPPLAQPNILFYQGIHFIGNRGPFRAQTVDRWWRALCLAVKMALCFCFVFHLAENHCGWWLAIFKKIQYAGMSLQTARNCPSICLSLFISEALIPRSCQMWLSQSLVTSFERKVLDSNREEWWRKSSVTTTCVTH